MRHEVIVSFGPGEEVGIALDGLEAMSYEEARTWLDQQFLLNECEPMRGSGKVLAVDKILSVANAVGLVAFQNEEWAQQYARAVSAALSKGQVRVDLVALTAR
ncbi:MAG: hypothetical protein IV092_20480 [Burkholderiaceae bacterium]|uniref:Uncharacterized protein n=1 Tax=Roseateles toxinivorans TaxID=270368 RepID=A0A4R6QIQ9_9BURK|nr:hypothetical protein [Roseateles toxinivorans]MBT9503631.1 hypothetical protein [Burkholderiaceae bacterium]TDP62713.1 hypothetical protein DES47_1068 [Roseateles toxinivorans]